MQSREQGRWLKMKNKKKGQVVMYGLLAGLVAAIIVSTISGITNKRDFPVIGASSLAILSSSFEAEKALYYIDQSAKYALQQSVYDLAQNGGLPQIKVSSETDSSSFELADFENFQAEDCKKFYGYTLWYEPDDKSSNAIKNDCATNEKIKLGLEYLFNRNLNLYLLNYPEGNILADNYIYEIKDNLDIVGKAIYELDFYVLKDQSKTPERVPQQVTEGATGIADLRETGFCKKGDKCSLSAEGYELLVKADAIARQKLGQNNIKNICLEKKELTCLEVTDGYRSLPEQIDIWEGRTPMRWAQRIPDPNLRKQKVCYPYGEDVLQRCSHLTGNAVDVRLRGKTFDTMTKKEWQIVHEAMTQDKKWVRYGDEKNNEIGELWHFECCGTTRYAKAQQKGVTAIV